jgi:hypothetical protein
MQFDHVYDLAGFVPCPTYVLTVDLTKAKSAEKALIEAAPAYEAPTVTLAPALAPAYEAAVTLAPVKEAPAKEMSPEDETKS